MRNVQAGADLEAEILLPQFQCRSRKVLANEEVVPKGVVGRVWWSGVGWARVPLLFRMPASFCGNRIGENGISIDQRGRSTWR